jgi:hypothetical protein
MVETKPPLSISTKKTEGRPQLVVLSVLLPEMAFVGWFARV